MGEKPVSLFKMEKVNFCFHSARKKIYTSETLSTGKAVKGCRVGRGCSRLHSRAGSSHFTQMMPQER